MHDNLQGRASKLEDGTFPEVGEDDGGAGPQGEERCQGDDSITKEGADPTKGRQWQGLYQRSVFSRPLRRIIPHGSHSTIIGRGVDSRAGSGETGDADPRVEASAGPSTQESSDEGGPRGEEPASDVLSRHGSEIDEKDGMAFAEQNSRPLGSTKENKILQQFQQSFEEDWDFLVSRNRCLLLEVCCSPDSVLTETCLKRFGPGSAVRVAHWNGGDVETEAGRNHVKRLIRELRPRLVWFAPECGPYSPMQHLNCRSEKQRKELEEKRKHARAQYDGVCELARYTHGFGLTPLLELSERCEGWNFPVFQTLKHDLGCFVGVCKGCQVGLRNELGELLGKGWKLMSPSEELVRHLSLRCTTDHPHGKCEGHRTCRQTAFYTPEFAKRVINHLKKDDKMERVTRELIDGKDTCGHMSINIHEAHEAKDDIHSIHTVSRERTTQILQRLRKIHSATGHCSNQYLVKALQKRNASEDVIEVARNFRCAVCDERVRTKPRPTATLHDIPPKWSRLQADVGTWVNPEDNSSWHFLLSIDEGSRLRVGSILGSGKHKSISAQDFIDFYETHWKPLFGKPSTIRLDPAGAFRSAVLDDYFSNRKVLLEHIPAEAHWQISVVERAIQSTKEIMSKLCSEFPEMTIQELFARAVWAQNSRDQYLGFSPLQHVLGKNPNENGELFDTETKDVPVITEKGISAEFGKDERAMKQAEMSFIEQQYKQRLERASRSGSRKTETFGPGDLVFYWRKQLAGENKKQSTQTFGSGAFLGPARVLATETKCNEDGSKEPGSIVWLFRGNRLLRAAPQQLRHASEREEAWCELKEDQVIPWSIQGVLDQTRRKTYDDISQELPPEGTDHDIDMDLQEPPQAPRYRFRRKATETGSRTTTAPRPIKQAKTEDATMDSDSALFCMAASEPSKHLEDAQGCIEIAIDLPKGKAAKKGFWMRDFEAFIVGQVKKNHIEVTEKKLTEEELSKFKEAKLKEVKNYITSRVFAKIPENIRPNKDQILRMRWVLTWKVDPDSQDRKAKARAVILGYQDPLYEHRPTASPTMSRSTRQLFLTACSAHKFLVEKGDVSGAFLQGRDLKDTIYIEPLPEICSALELPEGSVTQLTKAAYGLVQAPLEWYLTVDEFLTNLGFERQKSDPCCWGIFDSADQPIAYVCGHVDDFLFGGKEFDYRWKELKQAIQTRFKWGQWESKKFTQCGVDIEQREDFSFSLAQPSFLDQVSEIYIGKKRFGEKEASTTREEQLQLRSVLGCLSWHAGQLAMDLSAPVSLMLSKINTSTVEDIIEVNKLLRRAKSRKQQSLLIHTLEPNDLCLAAWVDAAHANRPDGSSTKGIFIGCTSQRILKGELETVNPIYWNSSKITRVCRSSASAETRAAVDGDDQMYALRFQLGEFMGHYANTWNTDETANHTMGILISDSKNLFDRLSQTMLTLKGAEKRSDLESLCLKESTLFNNTVLRWVNGDSQLGNSLTKSTEPQQLLLFFARNGRWRIVYDQSILSGKKRKTLGLGSLDSQLQNEEV